MKQVLFTSGILTLAYFILAEACNNLRWVYVIKLQILSGVGLQPGNSRFDAGSSFLAANNFYDCH